MKKECLFVILSCMLAFAIYGDYGLTTDSHSAGKPFVNEDKAKFESCRIKAEAGDLEALFNMGIYYIFGQGIGMNLTEGYRLVREAAEKGNRTAQNWMGDFYADYQSEEDMAQALAWWSMAAAQGDPNAQYSLGQRYEQGIGVAQNYKTATYWYRLAAEQGVSDAILSLSNCYLEGKGIKQDLKEALFWVLVCFPAFWDKSHPNIDRITKQMKPAEVKKAKLRAYKWLTEQAAKHKEA